MNFKDYKSLLYNRIIYEKINVWEKWGKDISASNFNKYNLFMLVENARSHRELIDTM